MTSAVLWDLDGTLVDSEDHHWRAWRDTLAADGLSVSYEQFLGSFGQRNDLILRGWFGDMPADRITRIGDDKEALYRRFVEREGVTVLPGAAEWVTRLREDGWLQAIASSAPRLNVDAVQRALVFGRCFQASVAAEDVRAGKPDPHVFLVAASRLGVEPARCIVVEDAVAGIEAARRAGMRSIGVSRTTTLGADLSVASLTDLPPDAFAGLVRQPGR
jgi:beta-phosphoglucomutase